MIHALTEQGFRQAEERVVEMRGVTLAELMDRAGTALAEYVLNLDVSGSVAVVAGSGNNGGDGWVAARVLAEAGREVTVFSGVDPEQTEGISGDAAKAAVSHGVVRVAVDGEMDASALDGFAVVVDSIFGIGFSAPVRGPFGTWFEAINASRATVVSADLPSGVDADTGGIGTAAVCADFTVTFSAPKVGLMLYPGAVHAGEIHVADIGIPDELLGVSGDLELWSGDDYGGLVPRPHPVAHKNSRGRVLVVAGSGSFPGAAALAAAGAQRMGAGYVTVAVPESIVPIIQTKLSSAVVVGLPENPSHTMASKVAEEILRVAEEFDAVVMGPGLTDAHGAVLVARKIVSELSAPLVVDADGLNALVDARAMLTARAAPTVITPHPGELARLLGMTVPEVQADRLSCAQEFSGPQFACVLKGAHTVTAGRGRLVINGSGGPALATAGTGDVLAGMVGALLAQGLAPLEAGVLAAYVHGRAGDLAAGELTDVCVIAEDIPDYIAPAVKELLGR